MFNIKVATDAEPMFRFNLIVVCSGYNPSGEQLFFVWGEDVVAEIGAKLLSPPANYSAYREVSLEMQAADNLRLLVYVIPHSMPNSKVVADFPPFPLEVTVSRDGEALHASVEQINQWGGASLLFNIQG